jgi:hypothetical protein
MREIMIKDIISNHKRITMAMVLISIGVLLRLLLYKNLPGSPSIYITINEITQPMFMMDLFFVVAIISLLSGLLLGGYYTFIVPISVMMISDIIIGNNWILLFTWSGFAILGLIGFLLKKKQCLSLKKIPTILGTSILGILFYDLWTNFGTWLGGFGYTYTWEGLVLCYTRALPFMFWHLLSTTIALILVLIPIVYLMEYKLVLPDFTLRQFEKHLPFIAPPVLMILALATVIL